MLVEMLILTKNECDCSTLERNIVLENNFFLTWAEIKCNDRGNTFIWAY